MIIGRAGASKRAWPSWLSEGNAGIAQLGLTPNAQTHPPRQSGRMLIGISQSLWP